MLLISLFSLLNYMDYLNRTIHTFHYSSSRNSRVFRLRIVNACYNRCHNSLKHPPLPHLMLNKLQHLDVRNKVDKEMRELILTIETVSSFVAVIVANKS